MMHTSATCPECGASFQPQLAPQRLVMDTPTGDSDHTIVDGAETLDCPICGERLEADVRRDLGGGVNPRIISPLRAARHPQWACERCCFSPSGRRIAVGLRSGVRVFQRDGEGWKAIFKSPDGWVNLLGWDGEERLIVHNAIWDLAGRTTIWQEQSRPIFVTDAAYDHGRGLLARGYASERDGFYMQVLELHRLAAGDMLSADSGRIDGFSDHVICWDLGRDLAFCARRHIPSSGNAARDYSELALWRYHPGAGSLEQVAEARLVRGLVQRAWWELGGTIMVAAWYRFPENPPYPTAHAHGLARLHGETLELLREQQWVGPPPQSYGFRFTDAAPLASGAILLAYRGIHLIDAATWAVRETLAYMPEGREQVAFSPDGVAYAIARPNDVIVVERAAGRGWSLRRGCEVPLRPQGGEWSEYSPPG